MMKNVFKTPYIILAINKTKFILDSWHATQNGVNWNGYYVVHIVINGLFLDFLFWWSKSDSCTLHLYILLNSSDKITHLHLILCDVNVWKKNSHESRNCWVFKSSQYILWSMNIRLHNSKGIFYILQPSNVTFQFLNIIRNVLVIIIFIWYRI